LELRALAATSCIVKPKDFLVSSASRAVTPGVGHVCQATPGECSEKNYFNPGKLNENRKELFHQESKQGKAG
jgi:hypothetical protein